MKNPFAIPGATSIRGRRKREAFMLAQLKEATKLLIPKVNWREDAEARRAWVMLNTLERILDPEKRRLDRKSFFPLTRLGMWLERHWSVKEPCGCSRWRWPKRPFIFGFGCKVHLQKRMNQRGKVTP